MKVAFSKETAYVPDYNENKTLSEPDRLSVTVKTMTLLDLLDLTDTLKQAGFVQGDVKDVTIDQMKTIVGSAGKYVPKYCALVNAEGFNVEDVVTYPTFLPLATELLFNLMNSSSPSEADVKNS